MGAASLTDLRELAAYLSQRAGDKRCVAAIVGAPGSGKSTISDALKAELELRHGTSAQVLPMDGFHYDNLVLEPKGDLPRKGAPHTFDVEGFAACLIRVAAPQPRDVAVPVFDRSLEIARASARIIRAETQVILVEGNYLLLKKPEWEALGASFDVTVSLECDMQTLRERLLERWRDHGYSEQEARAKAEGNDLPNAELVCTQSRAADFILPCDLNLARAQ